MNDNRCLIKEIMQVIEKKRLFVNPNLSIEDVAREVNSNRTYVGRAIRDLGMCYPAFINNYRAMNAISLLLGKRNLTIPLGDIAEMSGFSNVRQMNLYIKKSVGQTAGALRVRVFG